MLLGFKLCQLKDFLRQENVSNSNSNISSAQIFANSNRFACWLKEFSTQTALRVGRKIISTQTL